MITNVDWSQELYQFIKRYGGRRITRESLDFYSAKPADDTALWLVVDFEWVYGLTAFPAAVSCSAGINGEVKHSITITHPEHRRKGLGTLVLNQKISQITSDGFEYKTLVAEDNIPSKGMCEKSSVLKLKGEELRTRRSGEYKALVFGTDETK